MTPLGSLFPISLGTRYLYRVCGGNRENGMTHYSQMTFLKHGMIGKEKENCHI